MSTKDIRECLLVLKEDMPISPTIAQMVDRALQQVAAIERAAVALTTGGDMGEVTFANNLMENIAKDAPK